MYMGWIIGERLHHSQKTLTGTFRLVLSGGNMAVMAAAPVSMHSAVPIYPALKILSATDGIYSCPGYVRIFLMS